MTGGSDHVVFSAERKRFECRLCGAFLQASFPCSSEMLTSVGRAFIREHRGCSEVVDTLGDQLLHEVQTIGAATDAAGGDA